MLKKILVAGMIFVVIGCSSDKRNNNDNNNVNNSTNSNINNNNNANKENNTNNSNLLSEEQVKVIAFDRANVNASTVQNLFIHLDYDDGRQEYDIEFISGDREYDISIDAITGAIIEFDSDHRFD